MKRKLNCKLSFIPSYKPSLTDEYFINNSLFDELTFNCFSLSNLIREKYQHVIIKSPENVETYLHHERDFDYLELVFLNTNGNKQLYDVVIHNEFYGTLESLTKHPLNTQLSYLKENGFKHYLSHDGNTIDIKLTDRVILTLKGDKQGCNDREIDPFCSSYYETEYSVIEMP